MDDNQESIQLLQDIAKGSRHAFDRFYEKHIPFIYCIVFQMIGDRREAEDVCHEVFLEVFQKHTQYKPSKGSVKAWLAVKARSRSLDQLRKKKPLLINRLEDFLMKEEKGADIQFLSHLEKDVLIEAMRNIPVEQREVIYRSYFQGETHKEIAGMMNKPLGSVKSLIRYGLNNLRKQKSILNWIESDRGGKKNEI